MNKSKYYVSFMNYEGHPNSMEVEIDDFGNTPGMLAEILEGEVARIVHDQSVVIINFWKL